MKKELSPDQRLVLNRLMADSDPFFSEFGKLDDEAYKEAAIPKKYKELTGLTISIISHCNECVDFHIEQCLKANTSKEELIESIKMGVIGGGSVTYQTARYAFRKLKEINIIE